jgi:hypothetical protein
METINLNIQKTGNRYRFGLTVEVSAKYFKQRNINVVLNYKGEIFFAKTTCGQYYKKLKYKKPKMKKGFDLYSYEIFVLISELIEKNEFTKEKGSRFIVVNIDITKSNFILLTA